VSSFMWVLAGGAVVASLVAAGTGSQVRAAPTTASHAEGAEVPAVHAISADTPTAAQWIVTTFTPPDQPAYLDIGSLSASGKTNAWGIGKVIPHAGLPFSVVFRWNSKWRQVPMPARVVRDSPFSLIGSSSASNVWIFGGSKASTAHWNGSRWSAGILPLVRGRTPTITAAAVLSSSTAWAFGAAAATRTRTSHI
jgi:hypothetical protein